MLRHLCKCNDIVDLIYILLKKDLVEKNALESAKMSDGNA